jgi:uncharacterized lipoprotein YddW (UPF0748 family)
LAQFHTQFQPFPQRHQSNRITVRNALILSVLAVCSNAAMPLIAQAHSIDPPSWTEAQVPQSSSPQAQPVRLGVVRSAEQADRWQDIVDRLAAGGISYQVIDWQQVEQTTVFDGITVLFLPNLETVTPEQVLALQNWLNRGGGVITSGPLGNRASSGVRRSLQSLFGAYWQTFLQDPVRLQPVARSSQPWLRQGDNESHVIGGVLIPTDLGSQSVATWQTQDSSGNPSVAAESVAIVTTRQTVFLGWRWGDAEQSSTAFDSQWLTAVLNRFAETPPVIAASPQTEASQGSSPNQAPVVPEAVDIEAPRSPDRPSESVPPLPSARSSPRDLRPPVPPDESAPPGLVVEPGSAPISLVEAVAMQQELENLIGRFESALLAADSANLDLASLQPGSAAANPAESDAETGQPATLLPESNLTASTDLTLASVDAADPSMHPVLQTAQQKLKAFTELVRQRQYAQAREQWLSARQLLWDNLPTDRVLAQTEIRAVWLDRETIVAAGSRQGLAQIFDRLAHAGINTVFFETVNAGYPIYPSQIAPQQNPLTRHWDPLEAAVDLAHDRGMELHAWVWTFAAGNEAHNRLVNLPLHYPGPLLSAHPTWGSYDRQGNLILPGQEEPFLDPANPQARRYLLQLFEEIVTRYEVDGLQLDYIRYPFQTSSNASRTQGYGRAARQQFQRRWGVDPLTLTPGGTERDRQLWQQWTEFRVEQVNSFVAETSALLRQLDPDLILSAAVFSMPTQERIQKIQQNWEVWSQRGDVDMIVIMTYAADTNRLQQLASPWLLEETAVGSTIVLPGIRLLPLSDAAVFDQIQALRDLPSGGYALFAMVHLQENLQGILSRTQGSNPSDYRVPYRQPFAAASDRFVALQREWALLLSQDQLWIRDPEQREWRSQTAALQQALTELADNPSRQQLQTTQALLQTFQSQFSAWMRLQALTHPYRVQTWQHRLQTIANLVDYGDRVALERWEN